MTKPQRDNKPQKQTSPVQSLTSKPARALPEMAPLLAQQAVADPAQAKPGNLLNLQRFYGNRAMSDLIQTRRIETVSSQPVQRTAEDGKPDSLPHILDPATFKDFTTTMAWRRGDYIKTINLWLEAAWNAKTWDEQYHALRQLTDACDAWLDKHGAEPKDTEDTSVTYHRSYVQNIRQAAAGGQVSSAGQGEQVSVKQKKESEARNIIGGTSDMLSAGGGITGTYGDRNVVVAPDTYKGDFMNRKGSGKLNRADFDLLEGANMLGGWLKIFDAYKAGKEGEKLEAGKKGLEGTGQMLHGVGKFSKGIGLKKGGDSTKLTQVGDTGAACADGLAFISGLISTIQSFTGSAVTGREKVDKALDITSNVANTGQAGLNTALDVFKVASEVGAKGGKEAIANMAKASGIFSIVIGSIDIVQAGLQGIRAYSASNEIQRAEVEVAKILVQTFEKLQQFPKQLEPLFTSGDRTGILDLMPSLIKLRNMFVEMKELAHSLKAMKKIQNRKMEDAVFKGLQGGVKVVSGALIVSGVGAPIGVGVAALAGIMALGKAGVQWRRNAAASRLTTTALRLTEEGQPKGKPDDKSPDYRTMENRIYKCYYTHLPEVVLKKTPPGLSEDQFLDVKRFTWSDKKARVSYKTTMPLTKAEEIPTRDSEQVRNNWLVLNNEKGQPPKKEAPTGSSWALLKLTASGHKSTQSLNASKEEVVNALYALGSQSWNRDLHTFVDAPIVPQGQGEADPDTMQELKSVTLDALLKAANITPALWQKWDAVCEKLPVEKRPDKMKELIGKKIG